MGRLSFLLDNMGYNLKTLITLLRCPRCDGVLDEKREKELRCNGCGIVYRLRNGAIFFSGEPDDARRLHDAPSNKQRWSLARWRIFEYLENELKSIPRDTVVCDVGIGTGPFRELTDRFTTMVGVDFFPYAPVQVVADITKPLPFRSAAFDVVICSEVLEHIPNPHEVIKEMGRIMKNGGTCIGSVPFLHAIHYAPYDFYRYTPFALKNLFHDAGFSKIEIIPIGFSFEVYKVFQDRFFTAHLLPTRFSKNRVRNGFFSFIARAARKIHSILFSVMSPLYRRIPERDEWALAYCFKAYK